MGKNEDIGYEKKKFLTVILIMALSLLITVYRYSNSDYEYKSYGLNEGSIAIMVYDHESDAYIKQSNIPKGAKYSLNEELTNCEAGGKVTNYSKANGTLNYELKKADKCYVYFDVDNTPSYAIYSETDNSLIFYKNNDEVGSTYNGRVVTAKYDDIENSVYTYDTVNKVPNTPWYEYASVIKTVSVANEIMPISTAMWFRKMQYLESIELTNLNTSYVTTMERMFCNAAELSTTFNINLGDKFDTSQCFNMSAMFAATGRASSSFCLDLGDKFDTSNVTDMSGMFYETGKFNKNFELNLGNVFNTSKVTNMYQMFGYVGYSNPSFELDLSGFIIQNSCNLNDFAYNSASKIIFGEGWSNATLGSQMFYKDSSTPIEIVNAPANILSYNFAADNRIPTFTTI